jgi:hypothetical protein
MIKNRIMSEQQPISRRLKESISARHQRMETLPFFLELVDGQLPFAAYVLQLQAMAMIHSVTEEAVTRAAEQAPGDPLWALFLQQPSRSEHLVSDLEAIGVDELPSSPLVVSRVSEIAAAIRAFRLAEPLALRATVYLLWGTTLGNTFHVPDVERLLGAERARTTIHAS